MTQTVKNILKTLDYGPALENTDEAFAWLKSRKETCAHFIGGAFTKASKTFKTHNPATGDLLAKVALGSKSDVDKAVTAATKALKPWQSLSCYQRSKYLYALARLIQKNARLLAVLETLDNGKPIRESRDIDVPLAARHFYHHAGWAKLRDTEFPNTAPHGVVGQIIPWNFPLLMLAWKIAPALAAGNTVVLKPAELTPLTATLFAELCQKAGLPAGVVNIVHGDGTTGAAIVDHKDISKIAFTGSTEVGRIIREKTAGSEKELTLELGGKSPNIVFEDADLDSAIEGVVDSIWLNQGEVCCAGSRLLVQESISDRFIKKLKKRMETLRIGNPLDKTTDIGAVVDQNQCDNIDRMVKIGQKEGATVVQTPLKSQKSLSNGCFYPPTLLLDVQPSSTVAEQEIFGPVLSVLTFRTQDEALHIANNTRYGLAASIWSENINMALDLAPRIKAGIVWINGTNMMDAAVGFGGYRESGYGREGGREGMFAYLKDTSLKSIKAPKTSIKNSASTSAVSAVESIDRTAKLYIGGKQTRPDGNYSIDITAANESLAGQIGAGNRKDIRNAVEAAHKAASWSTSAHHLRAQILYYIAENLDARRDSFVQRLMQLSGESKISAEKEVEETLSRLFTYGAWCDKYDGQVHTPPARVVALAMKEAIGTVGVICPDEKPLLGFVSLIAPLIAMGNSVVAIPSKTGALAVTDLYQVFDTSDLPGGVVNIVTGTHEALVPTLASHNGIDALWSFTADKAINDLIKSSSAGNLKQTWCHAERHYDWLDSKSTEGEVFLRHATQIKNVWVPYGE